MAWSDTLDAFVEVLAAVDGIDAVLRVGAVTAAEIGVASTVAALTPAGHKTRRLSGGDRERTWTQRVTILRKVAGTNAAAQLDAIEAVTAATLAVDDALDATITLAGEATVVTPFSWDEGAAFEIPPGSKQIFAGQSGTCDIVVIGAGPRGA